MLEDTAGGIGEDFNLSPSGDYCSYYRVGGPVLTSQDSTNEGSVSGLTMPTPYSSYQEGDKTTNAHNACQADGTYWGQVVHGPSGKGCATGATCGMHHYVSFKSQNGSDRPWSSAFGEPSLVLSADAGITTVAPTTSYGGWGYLCPELEDTSTHGVLEYCFEEWRSTHDSAEWKNERKGECNNPFAQVVTYFWPGASYATEMSGSTSTFETESHGSGHFEAKITPANLKNAIKLINAQCGWHLSENPEFYALIGVEQGLEGWSGVTALGGWGANLQLHTEYTPLPTPLTVFYAGSGDTLQENWWTGSNWGYININMPLGSGSSPATDLFPPPGWYDVYFRGGNGELEEAFYNGEGGWHLIPLGHAVEAGTTPTIRHPQVGGYTVVYYAGSGNTLQESFWNGSNWGYTNVNIPIGAGSSPVADPHPPEGWDDVYFRGSNGELQEAFYNGEGGWHLIPLGHAVEAGTTPTIRHPQVGGYTVVYYAGSGDTLEEAFWNGEKWQYTNVNFSIGAGSSPVADPHPPEGWDDVYFRGSNGELQEAFYNGEGGWHLIPLGHAVEAGTTPTVVHPQVGGETYVFYTGSNGILQESWWNGSIWQWASLGAAVEAGTSPAGL